MRGDAESQAAFGFLKECFRAQVAGMKCETDKAQSRLRALFSFERKAQFTRVFTLPGAGGS